MKDNVTVVTKTTVAFDVTVPETQYCVSDGGAEVYLSGMQKDVTYQVVNTSPPLLLKSLDTMPMQCLLHC
jgi:hypothetical protein